MESESSPAESNNYPIWCVGHHAPEDELVGGETLETAITTGYDMITTHITNSAFRTRIEQVLAQAALERRTYIHLQPLTADEVNIQPGPYMTGVIGFVSPWVAVDSKDALLAHVSCQVLDLELAYAAFCGISHVVVGGPKVKGNEAQYAQGIRTALRHTTYMQLVVQLGMDEREDVVSTEESAAYDALSTWDVWNTIRTVCGYSTQLSIALQIPARLPDLDVIRRWFAEPVRIIVFSSTTFWPNNKGFPVLSKNHQALITKYMKLRPTPYILLANTNDPPLTRGTALPQKIRHEPHSYLIYMRHLQKNQPQQSTVEKFGSGYQDYLQAPLQPLTDNLESITYEVFEKDPVKYDQYEKAIKLALLERPAQDSIVVAVVGAGRGPLVSRALQAADESGRSINLIAVEKNPNAYVHLLRQNREVWQGQVTIIKSDMRSWNPPFQVDILISELLGSFGDNELSPECLDGVQRVLSPSGVMIPQSYSAHLTPIMAPKIHADISSRKNDPDAFETPYVVMLQSIELLAEDEYIHRVWDFSHPQALSVIGEAAALGGGLVGLGEGGNDHNLRSCKTKFKIPRRGIVHGLAGYFESVLYGDVQLSTRPDTINTKSKDMISWFPIFFPLKTPMYLPDSSEAEISIWRQSSDRKVWYEWMIEGFLPVGVRRSQLAVSELHSSKKNGCLM